MKAPKEDPKGSSFVLFCLQQSLMKNSMKNINWEQQILNDTVIYIYNPLLSSLSKGLDNNEVMDTWLHHLPSPHAIAL